MPLAVEGGVRLAVAGPVQPPRRGGAAAGAARAAAGVQGGRGLGRPLQLPRLRGVELSRTFAKFNSAWRRTYY